MNEDLATGLNDENRDPNVALIPDQHESSDETDDEDIIPPTSQEVREALDIFLRYAATNNVSQAFSDGLEKINFECAHKLRPTYRQNNIDMYFMKK